MSIRGAARYLLDLSQDDVLEWLKSIDTVITDCDEVLWKYHEQTAITGAAQAIENLRSAGKRVYFLTNNCTRTRHQVWQYALSLGFNIAEDDILTPMRCIIDYMKERHMTKKVYVIGAKAIVEELQAAGFTAFGPGIDNVNGANIDDYLEEEYAKYGITSASEVGAVITSYDREFSYGKLLKAVNFLRDDDCLYLAPTQTLVNKYPKRWVPDNGTVITAIEACVKRRPLVLGKPNKEMCRELVQAEKLTPARTLMIGDKYSTDMAFGNNCGFQTLFVETGTEKYEDIKKFLADGKRETQVYIPDMVVPSISDLSQFLPSK